MMCASCVGAVENALKGVPGVQSAAATRRHEAKTCEDGVSRNRRLHQEHSIARYFRISSMKVSVSTCLKGIPDES